MIEHNQIKIGWRIEDNYYYGPENDYIPIPVGDLPKDHWKFRDFFRVKEKNG